MKFKQIFIEKRKVDIATETTVSVLKRYCEKYGYENIYFQYVSDEKFGINPNNSFSTPFGIYAYPAEFLKADIQTGKLQMLFADNREFVNIFTVKSGKILNLQKYTKQQLKSDLNKIDKYLSQKYADKYLKMKPQILKSLEKEKSTGEHLWFILQQYTNILSKKTDIKEIDYKKSHNGGPVYFQTQYFTIEFSNILNKVLGYIGVIDSGGGIIYSSEPIQSIFFNKKDLQLLDRIHNVLVKDDKTEDNKLNEILKNPSLYGIKKITYDKSLKLDLKNNWFIKGLINQTIKVYNADVVILDDNSIIWKNGSWIEGKWIKGVWVNGIRHDYQ